MASPKIVAAHQPNYIPWLGYFYKMSMVDVFVVLDHVQYAKEGFQNRNQIKTPQGVQWLTLPVLTKGKFAQATSEVELNSRIPWRRQHLNTFEANYARAPYYRRYAGELREIYSQSWSKLVDPNLALMNYVARHLEITTPIVRSSELLPEGKATTMLVEICRKIDASVYLSGFGGANYQSIEEFRAAGIECRVYDFAHPEYPQIWGNFRPNLSALDLLFNCGADAKHILRQHGRVAFG